MNNWGHVGRTKSPCRGCQDRQAECHSSCEKYLEFYEIHNKERADAHHKKRLENLGFGAPYRTEKRFKEALRNK